MEARLAAVLEELGRQSELQRAAEQREQQLQNNIQMLESELLTALMSKDFQSHEKQEVSSCKKYSGDILQRSASSQFSGCIFCFLYLNTGAEVTFNSSLLNFCFLLSHVVLAVSGASFRENEN